jgi:aminopeptidase N
MLSFELGERVLKEGVSGYLRDHLYQSASQKDLLKTLTVLGHLEGSFPVNMTLEEVMDSWTRVEGHPVLFVTRNYRTGHVKIRQVIIIN